ncbi:MAG: NAD(P)H-dependent oxidoreductase subunit E [Opitutales bacterium]|nr:NAD(P)H-dependent oxidoreductase subunit E [Opitutales bacterium]
MNLKAETLAEIEKVIPQYPVKRSALMPLIHAVQADLGYVSDEAMAWIAAKLEIEPVSVLEVVTFYPYFRRKPIGKHHVRVCRTLSCALNGSYNVLDTFKEEFANAEGGKSFDDLVTVEFCECLASCHTGPAVLIDETLYEKVDEAKARELARAIKAEGESR